MQCVLTQEEFDALHERPAQERHAALAAVVQKLGAEILKARGYTCIHDREGTCLGRCDDCPLSVLHKGDEKYHKLGFLNYEESKLACTRPRSYSK